MRWVVHSYEAANGLEVKRDSSWNCLHCRGVLGLTLPRIATLAQLVERSFRKAQVTGSSPVGGCFRCFSLRRAAWALGP